MNENYLLQLLVSTPQLAISDAGLASLIADVATAAPSIGAKSLFGPSKTYFQKTQDELKALNKSMSLEMYQKINLTSEYDSNELPTNSVAYHRVWGVVTSASRYNFSSKRLEKDMKAADTNPAISVHFLHINSPGGEAWYLDRLTDTMQTLSKPIFVFIEKCCASAAYYIGSQGAHIYAVSHFDNIGCIGTMLRTYNMDKLLEKWGLTEIVVKSTGSDLKNKKYEDLLDGKPKQVIEEELDPLNAHFHLAIRRRKQLTNMSSEDPVFRGETFQSDVAIEKGLIDGICTFEEACEKAYQLGLDYASKMLNSRVNKIL